MLTRTQVSALVMDITGLAVPDFLAMLGRRTELTADWLVRSIDACGQQGSSAYYSRLFHPLRGWAPASPETTGPLIPTLIAYSRISGRVDLAALAVLQARWLSSLQSLDGSFPGGLYYARIKNGPSVFSTGQVMLGLIAAADQTNDSDFLQSAAGAARWLCDELNESAGIWLPHPQAAFQPAHYSCVCWAMLEVWRRTREPRIHEKALRALQTIASWERPEGSVNNWGLEPDRPAFTDSIAQTLRGLTECGRLLGQEGQRYSQIAARMAAALRDAAKADGRPAGAYDPQLNQDNSLVCVPGSCQMSRIWFEFAGRTRDVAYFRTALCTLWQAIRKQKTHSAIGGQQGALPAAIPSWSRYWRLRSVNWAATAFLDAALEARQCIERCPAEQHEPGPEQKVRGKK